MTIHSVIIQKLLTTNAHLGRRITAHHFKIYSTGTRNAMSIIDSDKTLISLRNACHFISNLVQSDAKFLFVNTNNLFNEILHHTTRIIGCKTDDSSWKLGGFLSNASSPRKFRGRNKKLNLGAVEPPDCVVIFDTERKSSVVYEADRLRIPVVGLVDSGVPWDVYKRITYPIPGNDSVGFVYLVCNLITKTFLYEKKKKNRLGKAVGYNAVAAASVTDGKAEIREEAEQINQSKSKTDNTKDKIFVLPYEGLVPTTGDPLEIKKLLDKLVVLTCNNRLGTKMGFTGPKSAIEVCNGLTCLDLIVNQIESINSKYGCNIPLLLINTDNTHDSTLKVLEKHSNKNIHTFIQGEHQRADVKGSVPLPFGGQNIEDETYPSDYGDIFLSLKHNGKFDVLLSQGKEYILVLNPENVADCVDPKILNHLIQSNIEYCMEVMPASSNLEEIDHSHKGKFQSKENLKLTNTMWMSMKSIEQLVERISLKKEKYPISKFFDRSVGVNIPQSRYLPVEATSDILLLQSDLFTFTEGTLTRNKARVNPSNPSIDLGPQFEKVSDFHSRFKSIPSIIELDSLKVTGDVWFGTGITLKGKVSIVARPGMKIAIPDGVVLENKVINSPWNNI